MFRSCFSLKNATIGNGITSLGENTFWRCNQLETVSLGTGITSIGNHAFDSCSSLENVNIPNGVTTIGEYAFYSCSSLTNIILPDTVSSIGTAAFRDCDSLTNITIPSKVTSIGENTFRGCSSLESIIIPKSVTSIGNHAFYQCSKLENVYYTGTDANFIFMITGEGNDSLASATKHYNYGVLLKYTIGVIAYNRTQSDYSACGQVKLVTDQGTLDWSSGGTIQATEGTTVRIYAEANSGFEFVEWRLGTAGYPTGTLISTDASYSFTATQNLTISNDKLLHAIFRETHTITFNPNGGGGTMDSVTVGGTYTLPTTTTFIAPEGKQFKGWSLTIDGDIITSIDMNENKSVYAVWEDKVDLHTHSYIKTTTKATLSKDGSIVEKCSCGDVKSSIVIPKINDVTLSKTLFTYNKKVQKPSVTIKDRTGKVLKDGTDYTLSYSNKNSKKVGEYKVTVTFKGDYSGSKTLTYQITPKGTKLSKVTKGKKQFKATWKKQTTETTGYQVQYSTSKNFSSGNKTITIKKNKTTSSTAKKLKSKKKYYVRIRTYKTVNGKKIYSGWSASKSVKTK